MGEILNKDVPRSKCVMDFIAELGEQTKNAWIFMDQSCIEQLLKSKGVIDRGWLENHRILTWEKTDNYPKTTIIISHFEEEDYYVVVQIDAEDIAFKLISEVKIPERIIILKMAV